MAKFACEHCRSRMRVPDEYAGKRVKCPGCGQAVRVPGQSAEGGLDFSLLDDAEGDAKTKAKPRKLRSILIGCGACGRAVHIPENRLGSVTPCPKCKVRLQVDRLELPETAGATIDFKHLELDPVGEPSLLGETTAGGSLAGLTGTGALASTGVSQAGMSAAGGSFVGTAQDQMAELRQLNDQRASGAISEADYRKRKAAIYGGSATAAAARAAVSRSASGASEQAIRVDTSSMLPGPVKAVIALLLLGVGGYVAWEVAGKSIWADIEASTTAESAKERLDGDADATSLAAATPNDVEQPEPADTDPDADVEGLDEAEEAPSVDEFADGPSPLEPPTPVVEAPTPAESAPAERLPPGSIALWDVTYPDTNSPNPMHRHSTFVRKMKVGMYEATIGVGIGPAAADLEDMAFRKYESDLRQSLYNDLDRVGDFEGFTTDDRNGRVVTVAGTDFHEVIITGSVLDGRAARISVLTGVQDGYAVTYWFEGSNRLYKRWQQEGVGNATIE